MTRLLPLLLLAPLSFLACSDSDDEEDEQVSDDIDGDGLSNDEEAALGTDPESADSDGDGWSDKEEADLGTDPLDPFSWEYGTERWPDFSDEAEAAGVSSDVWDRTEVFPNFATTDQYGGDIELYDFYGYVIMIDFSAGWCGPCRLEAEIAEEFWEDYREYGFVIIHAMIDNNQGTGQTDQDFLEGWADQYDIEFPVLNGGSGTEIATAYEELYYSGVNTGAIPFMILLDQDMELKSVYIGSGQSETIASKVERMLDL